MANYANAKATIAANIYTNHLGKVTAEMVKTAINEVVDTLIAGGYLYAGVAKLTPTQTNPGSPDANVFYIATEPGTYTNFVGAGGSLVVAEGEVAIFKFNGTWSKEVTGAATAAQVNQLGQNLYTLFNIFEQGGINGSTGEEVERNDRLRSTFLEVDATRKLVAYVNATLTYTFYVAFVCYTEQKVFISTIAASETQDTNFPAGTKYVRMIIQAVGNPDITPSDFDGVYIYGNILTQIFVVDSQPISGSKNPISGGAVFDAVALINASILEKQKITINDFVQGGISGIGADNDRADRIKTTFYKVNPSSSFIVYGLNTANTKVYVSAWDKDYSFISVFADGWIAPFPQTAQFPSGTKYIRLCVGYIDNNNITPADFGGVVLNKDSFIGLDNFLILDSVESGRKNPVSSDAIYQKFIQENINSIPVNGTFNLISRLGYKSYEQNTPPQSSIPSYLLAYQLGFREMLVDIRVTADGKFVSGHDDDIRGFGARNADGTTISNPVLISTHTLAELNEYDYGIYKGSQYAGLKLLTIEDFLHFCKMHNLRACLEFKTSLSDSEFASFASLVKECEMEDDSVFRACMSGAYPTSHEIERLTTAFPNAEIWCGYPDISSTYMNQVLALNVPETNKYNMCISIYNHTIEGIIADLVANAKTVRDNGIYIWLSEMTAENILALQEAGVLKYVRNINTDDISAIKQYLYSGTI